jgi:hypothetical protein
VQSIESSSGNLSPEIESLEKVAAAKPSSGRTYYVEIDRNVLCPDSVPRIKDESRVHEELIEFNGEFLFNVLKKVEESHPDADKKRILKETANIYKDLHLPYLLQIHCDFAVQNAVSEARKSSSNPEHSNEQTLDTLMTTLCRICYLYNCVTHKTSSGEATSETAFDNCNTESSAIGSLNSKSVGSRSSSKSRKNLKTKTWNVTYALQEYKHSHVPCNHTENCDKECQCCERQNYCEKLCLCPRTCTNRFKGKKGESKRDAKIETLFL